MLVKCSYMKIEKNCNVNIISFITVSKILMCSIVVPLHLLLCMCMESILPSFLHNMELFSFTQKTRQEGISFIFLSSLEEVLLFPSPYQWILFDQKRKSYSHLYINNNLEVCTDIALCVNPRLLSPGCMHHKQAWIPIVYCLLPLYLINSL